MKKKFKVGDRVITHTGAIFQKTLKTLDGLTGTIEGISPDYEFGYYVRLDKLNKVLEFAEDELTHFEKRTYA